MAHFARIDENSVVLDVTHLDNSILIDENGNESEDLGVQYLLNNYPEGEKYIWKQCSYNNNFRHMYPGIGSIYDANADVFVNPPDPFRPSWVMDENYNWVAPIPKPEVTEQEGKDGYIYEWDEESLSWIKGTLNEFYLNQ